MKKIFLVTKLKTTNIGNEALSNEIIRLYKEKAVNAIINVNGRPFGLDGYLPSRLLNTDDPIVEFERWTDKIVKKIKSEPKTRFEANNPKISLYNETSGFKADKWKTKLRPLKRLYQSLFVYSGEYKKRASVLKSADWLVYCGAGEVNDHYGNINASHVFLRQLLEIRVAQKLGLHTAAINQSIFIKSPLFKTIIAHVYSKMKKIVLRGDISKAQLIEFGVPAELIEIAPDSAVNTQLRNNREITKNQNKVGINFPSLSKITEDEIGVIINHLRSLGKDVVYCTNEPYGDMETTNMLLSKFNVRPLSGFNNYREYAEQLSSCDFIISARVHTNMLSLVSHTIVIPIEVTDFRLAELMDIFKYPIPIIKSLETGWVNILIKEINRVNNNEYDFNNYFKNEFEMHKMKTMNNVNWINGF